MSIVTEALVVNLQIGIWQGYRLDKEASRAVTEQANADVDAARVNKHLVPKESLKPIVSASTIIRNHFYANTLPWKDNGDRLLTRKLYMKFIEEHSAHVETFNAAVDAFLDTEYPKAIARAEFRMGDLFKPEDYPRPYELRRRFYAKLDVDGVSDAGDFRVAMEDNEKNRIRAGMEQAMQERIGRAMQSVWARLADTLGHFVNKMGTADAVFQSTTITNLQEIVELLPALNVLNDPELERIRADVEGVVKGINPQDMRKNPDVRAEVADEAKKIMEDMAGFMKAMGGSN